MGTEECADYNKASSSDYSGSPVDLLLWSVCRIRHVLPRLVYFNNDCDPEKHWEWTNRKGSDWKEKSHNPRLSEVRSRCALMCPLFHVYIKHVFDLAYSWYKYIISQLADVR